jgi:hypothetical protein
MKHATEERIRHRHQRQRVDLAGNAVTDPHLGERARRRGFLAAAKIRITLDEPEIILLDPGRGERGKRQDFLERPGLRDLCLLVRP